MKTEQYAFSAAAVRRAIQNKKDGNQIHVQSVSENECYITNGSIALLLSRFEYNRVIRPITGQEFGSYRIMNGHLSGEPADIQKAFKGYYDGLRAAKDTILQDSPVTICENGKALTGLYSAEQDLTVVVNKLYLDAFQDCTFLCAGLLQPVFALSPHTDIVGMILPVKDSRGNVSRAVRSYFVAGEEIPAQVAKETEAIRAALSDAEDARLAAEDRASAATVAWNRAEAKIKALSAQLAELEAQRNEAETAASAAALEVSRMQNRITKLETKKAATVGNTADQAAERFADLPGVTVTVKGAQTATPVVWISGNVQPNEAVLKQRGAKWSAKRAAWYYSVA